jgi:hypothetical protein
MVIKPMVSISLALLNKIHLFLLDSARVSLLISKKINKDFGIYLALNYNPYFSSGRKTIDEEFDNSSYSMALGVSYKNDTLKLN